VNCMGKRLHPWIAPQGRGFPGPLLAGDGGRDGGVIDSAAMETPQTVVDTRLEVARSLARAPIMGVVRTASTEEAARVARLFMESGLRSEERRVGHECRA